MRTSATFYPGAVINRDLRTVDTDLVLLSEDRVKFHVQVHRLISSSQNKFNHLLPLGSKYEGNGSGNIDRTLSIPEAASVVDVILHAVYRLLYTYDNPTLSDITTALAIFPKYGLSVEHYMKRFTSMHRALSSHTTSSPLDVYALAASYNLEEIAVETSLHLLSLDLNSISYQQASQIGTLYLDRLFNLHLERVEVLKALARRQPERHIAVRRTGANHDDEHNELVRAWALTASHIDSSAKPDLAVTTIESIAKPFQEGLKCYLCKAAFTNCLRELLSDWSCAKASSPNIFRRSYMNSSLISIFCAREQYKYPTL